MELGGNAPFMVCKDANLNDALDGAMLAKMRNSGEACTAANRFYVHKDVPTSSPTAFAARLEAIKVGPDRTTAPTGPDGQRNTRSKIASWWTMRPARAAGWSPAAQPTAAAIIIRRPCWPTCRPMPTC